MVQEITPGLIDAMIEAFVPDPRLAMFTHTAGGAVTRVDDLATAFPHRNAETMMLVGGGWMDPAQDEEAIALARNWFAQLDTLHRWLLRQHRLRRQGSRRRKLRPGVSAAGRNQGPLRPGQPVPAESQRQTGCLMER